MEYYFIINPIAGKTDVSETVQAMVCESAQELGIAQEVCHFLITEYAGHAKEIARELAQTGHEIVLFAVGGDGTLNEVLAGAYPYKNAAVGCIPFGSGNDFLRNYAAREDFLCMKDQLLGSAVDIDLLQIGENISASICSVGFDARVAYGIPKFRRLPLCGGSMAYNLSIAQQLCSKIGQEYRITLDGETFEQDCLMVTICNGTCYGGGFMAAPEASITDGLIDVICVRKMSLLRIAKVIAIYKKGNHLKNGCVIPELQDVLSFHRVKSVTIAPVKAEEMVVTMDGECAVKKTMTVNILPKAGRIFLPKAIVDAQVSEATCV